MGWISVVSEEDVGYRVKWSYWTRMADTLNSFERIRKEKKKKKKKLPFETDKNLPCIV